MPGVILIVIALIAAGVHYARHRSTIHGPAAVAEVLLRYWLAIAVGLASIIGALFHIFDGEQIAQQICFTRGDGGFQFENAMGDLAIGVVGVMCLFIRDTRFWLAVIVVLTIQYWGDAYGHIHQMVVNDNHCSDNTGLVLWTDIILPLVAIILYAVMHRGRRAPA